MRRGTRKPKRASSLYTQGRFSPELNQLASERIARGRCMECGGKPTERECLCASCWSEYPKITNIGEPDDAWQWRVRQTKPAYLGGAFWAERSGIFERDGRSRVIGLFDSFDEAKQATERNLERSIRAAEIAMGVF
jgi:hypothetical protein